MKRLTFDEIVSAIGGKPDGKTPQAAVARVCTDTREIQPGDLFFALPGEQFDGHDFVDAALSGGAAAAVVSDAARVPVRWRGTGRMIVVRDAVDALGRLAAFHRTQAAALVIGVVGSNGKTTTKEMIRAVLASRKRGRAALKSFNNQIGVPLTLLSVETADEFVVVEIGTNHPGEIATLAQIARPDIGVVTSIGEEHLEFFGDVSKVAEEELSLLGHIRRRGCVVMQADCRKYVVGSIRDDLTVLTFGVDAASDMRATDVRFDGGVQRFKVNERFEYELPTAGVHNVSNALAAIAVGMRLGMGHAEIAAALATAKMPPMRLERREIGDVTLINDAYNANPTSMRAALASMEQLGGRRRQVVVLGDMRELGADSGRYHEELGRAAGRSTASVIVAVGAFSRTVADGATSTAGAAKRIYWHPNVETAGAALEELIEPGDVVLLKGSRAVRLERVVPAIERAAAQPVEA